MHTSSGSPQVCADGRSVKTNGSYASATDRSLRQSEHSLPAPDPATAEPAAEDAAEGAGWNAVP